MRLLWIADHQITSPFEIPSALWTENLEQWSIPDTSGVTRFEDFLSGRSEELIEATRGRLPGEISRFQAALHERDVELAREFFLRGPKRNAELRSAFHLHDAVVPQVELDDLLVLRRANAVAQPAIVG